MALLLEWGTTLHNRMILCLLVARALAPSRRIPTCLNYLTCRTCRTCRTYLTYLTYHWNKTTPHWRVRHSLQPHFTWLARADSVSALRWPTI